VGLFCGKTVQTVIKLSHLDDHCKVPAPKQRQTKGRRRGLCRKLTKEKQVWHNHLAAIKISVLHAL
jgi:hypothetical protein